MTDLSVYCIVLAVFVAICVWIFTDRDEDEND
jgi:hypothetical protein